MHCSNKNTTNFIYLKRNMRNSTITVITIAILITVVIINQCYNGSTVCMYVYIFFLWSLIKLNSSTSKRT